jgi:hypothetical protein
VSSPFPSILCSRSFTSFIGYPDTGRTFRALFRRQIIAAERIGPHSVWPVRADEGGAPPHFLRLLVATVQAFCSDHLQQRRGAGYSGSVKFMGRNLARVAAYQPPSVNLEGRGFQQDHGSSVAERSGPTVCRRDFAHFLSYHTWSECPI